MLESAKTVFAILFIIGTVFFLAGVPDAVKNRKTMSDKDFWCSLCVGLFFGAIAIWGFYCYWAVPKGTPMKEAFDLIFNRLR